MANLLTITAGLALKKRKDNENTGTLSSLQRLSPITARNVANTAGNGGNNGGGGSLLNARQDFQQMNNQFQQQAEQRRQQEEQERQRRIQQMRQEQERRQQQEAARRQQEQQARQQKQQQLLNSSMQGAGLLQNNNKLLNNDVNSQPTAVVKKEAFNDLAKNGGVRQTIVNNINKGNELVNNAALGANPWKKYYGEEKQKIRDESFKRDWGGSTLQDIFNSGWDNRLAEVNARNRYANEQLNKAYEDNGNIKNQALVNSLKKITAENTNVARQYGEQEHANSRALGASYDSDYKDNPFLATLNAVRRMDVGNAMTGSAEGGGADVAKFGLNLLPGMLSSPISGVANTAEAIAGNGLDEDTGKKRGLTGLERVGRGVSGGIDLVGTLYGGSGDLLNSMGKALFKKGATEAVKEATKNTTKDVIKGYLKSMFEEGAEEGVQQAFEFFGNGGKLTTSDGEFDSKAFQQMLAESGQAAALGVAGGGLFHAGGRAIDAARAGISNLANRSAKANTNNDTNIVPSRIATTTDGTMVKQNSDGTTSRLTDSELANTITNNINKIGQMLVGQNQRFATVNGAPPLAGDMSPIQNNQPQIRNDSAAHRVGDEIHLDGPGMKYKGGNSLEERGQFRKDVKSALNDRYRNNDISNNIKLTLPDGRALSIDNKAVQKLVSGNFDKVVRTAETIDDIPDLLRFSELVKNEADQKGKHEFARRWDEYVAKRVRMSDGNLYDISHKIINRDDENNDVLYYQRQRRSPYRSALDNNLMPAGASNETIPQNSQNVNQDTPGNTKFDERTQPKPLDENGPQDITERYLKTSETTLEESVPTSRKSTPKETNLIDSAKQYNVQTSSNELSSIQDMLNRRGIKARYDADTFNGTNENAMWRSYQDENGNTVREVIFNPKADSKTIAQELAVHELSHDIFAKNTKTSKKLYEGVKKWLNNDPEYQNQLENLRKIYGDDAVIEEEAIAKTLQSKFGNQNEINRLVNYKPTVARKIYDWVVDKLNRVTGGKIDRLYWADIRNKFERAYSENGNYSKSSESSRYSKESESEGLPKDFDIDHYVTDQVKAQQKRSKAPLKERITDATAELKHYLVDDAVAYERYITDKNERLKLREGVDRVRSSDIIARQFMKDNGLGEIGKMPDANLNEFQQYLIAKRAQEVEAQGKATGRNKAADQALIDRVGDKYAREEATVRQYTRKMLEYSAENGLISEKLKDRLIKENPNYVPMNRVFDVIEKKTGFKSKQLGNLSKQSVVQKMTGSERVIDNPIESLMANTMRMINEAERNKTATLIHESEYFHEKTLKDGEKPHPGYDKLSYMVDGKTVSYEVPELVAKEMKNLNNVIPKAAENILKVVGAPTRWLRSGATQNNPIFAASNLLRDQMQTLVTGKTSANIRGTKDALKATFGWSRDARSLREELNRAGIIGSEYRQTYGYKSGNLVKQLQADNNIKKGAIERIKHPIDAIGDLIGRTEYFTRAQQYFGTKGDATTKAQAARNNTLNFGRAGATTRILNRIIPFLNAGVQGGRITVNSFKNRPVHTTLAMATLTGVALAAKGAAEAQDKELWDRLDDSDKGQNIIIFTPDAHYDSESNRVEGIIKIPVAQMLYPLMDAANNLKGDASDAITLSGDILTAVTGLESPNQEQGLLPVVNQLTPTAVKPFLEGAMNKSSYTGNDLVSEYDSNKEPEDKGSKYTTGLARTIAGATGIDAPVVDNFIQNWGGGLAKDLSKVMTDNPDNKSDGGGVGAMFNNGFNRRFLSGTVESQYEIAEGLANNYKDTVKKTGAFKNLSSEQQQKVLNAIDTDMNSIASLSAKVEQRKAGEDDSLTKRQTEIVSNGFNADSYIKAITDKKNTYSGSGDKSAGKTLVGNILDYGKTASRNNATDINDTISEESKSILNEYNSMTSKEWDKYINGSSAKEAAAEYTLAKAKYENSLANGELSDVQKVKKEKELKKLAVSKDWEKKYRDAYGLAGNKADMQEYLNGLDDEKRADTVEVLNGLNQAMLEAGVIKESTYKSRYNAINNTTSKRGRKGGSRKKSGRKSGRGGRRGSSKSGGASTAEGISSAEASALSSLAETMAKNTGSTKVNTPDKPVTNRKMNQAKLSNTPLANYTPSGAKRVTVTKGAKRSIA